MGATVLTRRVASAVLGSFSASKRGRWLRLALAVLLAHLPAAGAGAQPAVAAVELVSDVELTHPGEIRALVAITPGAPLSGDAVRHTLRNLWATGLAAEIEIWSRPAGEGEVTLVVALWGNVTIEAVELEGELPFKRVRLEKEVGLRRGQPLIEDRVLRSVYRLQDRLHAEGYRDAKVRVAVDDDPRAKTARVTFTIDPGERWTIGSVSFDGDPGPLQSDQLQDMVRVAPGEPYREAALARDADRLRRRLIDAGYLIAETEPARVSREGTTRRVDVVFPYQRGPHIEVEVLGGDRDKLRRKGLLPMLGAEGYDEALVLESVGLLRSYYQARGHYRVEVETREEGGDEERLLTIEIRPGPVFILTEISFSGNDSHRDAELRALMNTVERSPLRRGSGRLVEEQLASDLENIRAFYALAGWGDVEVRPTLVREDGENLRLEIPIIEGPRRRIVAVRVDGTDGIELPGIPERLPISAGGPYHPQLVDDGARELLASLDEQGYRFAQVTVDEAWNGDRTLVEITLEVRPGPRQLVGHLIVRGNWRTRTELVRSTAKLKTGTPVSRRRLAEVQRDLYRLGVFSRVSVETLPLADAQRGRDVVATVEEGRVRRILYGISYDSDDGFGGLLGVSHGNLLSRALRLQLDARYSQESHRFRLVFHHPPLGRRLPVDGRLTLYDEDETRPGFTATSRGVQLLVSNSFRFPQLAFAANYRRVDSVPLADSDEDIDREYQDINITSVAPRVVWDRRDDPLEPRHGWQTIVQLEYAFPTLGSEEEFVTNFAQQSAYLDFGRLGVLGASLRAGAIEPLTDRSIPVAERFFAGGRTSHRAFARDLLGIPGQTLDDDGRPTGGNGLLLLNLDYRVPLIGDFWGTVFFDAGNVWPEWRDVDPVELRPGVGIGARYLSPIGPLRIEVGWKLDREADESPYEIFLSFGNAF